MKANKAKKIKKLVNFNYKTRSFIKRKPVDGSKVELVLLINVHYKDSISHLIVIIIAN